jgi:magnesium-transporting ATPase (P-type)
VLGAIAVRDELRSEAAEVIAGARRDGYHVAMLTGDNQATAAVLAAQAGIDAVHAELRPEDKATLIERLRAERPTALVGDGVNDAPALATADLGIAMGAWAPTSPSKPPTSPLWAETSDTCPKHCPTPAGRGGSCCKTSGSPWPSVRLRRAFSRVRVNLGEARS